MCIDTLLIPAIVTIYQKTQIDCSVVDSKSPERCNSQILWYLFGHGSFIQC